MLLVGRDGPWLLALPLTSKDHDGSHTRDGRPHWVDIGAGAWDRRGARARCASTGSCGWGRMPCAVRARCSPASASRRWPTPWPPLALTGGGSSRGRAAQTDARRTRSGKDASPRDRLAPGRHDAAAGRGIPLLTPSGGAVDPQAHLLLGDAGEGELPRAPGGGAREDREGDDVPRLDAHPRERQPALVRDDDAGERHGLGAPAQPPAERDGGDDDDRADDEALERDHRPDATGEVPTGPVTMR